MNILEALYKLLKSDEYFRVQGHVTSVYYKMSQLNLPEYLERLNSHDNQQVFQLAQDILDQYNFFDTEFGENDIMIEDKQMAPFISEQQDNNMNFNIWTAN